MFWSDLECYIDQEMVKATLDGVCSADLTIEMGDIQTAFDIFAAFPCELRIFVLPLGCVRFTYDVDENEFELDRTDDGDEAKAAVRLVVEWDNVEDLGMVSFSDDDEDLLIDWYPDEEDDETDDEFEDDSN